MHLRQACLRDALLLQHHSRIENNNRLWSTIATKEKWMPKKGLQQSDEDITKEEEDKLSLGSILELHQRNSILWIIWHQLLPRFRNDNGIENKEKAQNLKNIMVKHLQKGCQL